MNLSFRFSPGAPTAAAALLLPCLALTQETLDEVVVTAVPRDRTAADLAQSVTVLDADTLDRARAASIGETLEGQLGMSASYFGAGASRPVIRGLAGARVRTMEDGIDSMDLSTVSADHAVGIEPLVARQIEIFRGPTTLLYGSGAVGGVVNTVTNRIPQMLPEDRIEGAFEIRGDTVADERAGALALDGGAGAFAWHFDAVRRETGDYEIPGLAELAHDGEAAEREHGSDGFVENSDLDASSYAFGGAWLGEGASFGAAFSGFEMQYGVPGHEHEHEEEHEGELGHEEAHAGVRIDLEQRRMDVAARWSHMRGIIEGAELRIGANDYAHIELEGSAVGTRFDNDQYEARLEMLQRPIGRWSGTFGVQLGGRDFSAIGEEAFVPPVDTSSSGIFAIEQADVARWNVALGMRLETRTHEPSAGAPRVDGNATSLSAGAIRDLGGDRSFALNLASAERLPAAEELYARGPHLASGIVEIGDASLGTERARHLDVGIRRDAEDLRWSVTAFLTDYADFIFARDTGSIDTETELPVFAFSQRDATFRGLEAEVFRPIARAARGEIDVRLFADYVEATLDDGANVPRIPPLRFGFRLQYHDDALAAGIEATRYADQSSTAPFEEPTSGYTLVSADFRWDLSRGGIETALFVRGTNLLDADARRHVSLVKEIAPLPGRNLTLGIRARF